MKQKGNTEEQTAAALDSLEGMRRASPPPYFYTRLQARLRREQSSWNGIASLISRPLFALGIIAAVLFVNGWIVLRNGPDALSSGNAFQVATDLPEEYNVAVTSFYDYETPSHE
ncbi:MAG: hypothetical protein ABW019_14640 [Chitinophagaceae bacterium]